MNPRRSCNVFRRESELAHEEDDENVVVLVICSSEMGEMIDVVTNASPGAEHSTIGIREMRRNPMVEEGDFFSVAVPRHQGRCHRRRCG